MDDRHDQASGAMGAASCPADGHCITCADEALPARVLRVDELSGLAVVSAEGTDEEVDISLVGDVRPGQILLVHAGVAIAQLEEE